MTTEFQNGHKNQVQFALMVYTGVLSIRHIRKYTSEENLYTYPTFEALAVKMQADIFVKN